MVSESRVTEVEAETEDGVEARGATIEEAVSNALGQLGREPRAGRGAGAVAGEPGAPG